MQSIFMSLMDLNSAYLMSVSGVPFLDSGECVVCFTPHTGSDGLQALRWPTEGLSVFVCFFDEDDKT